MLTFHSDWNSLKLMPPSLSVSNMAIIMRQVSGLKGRQVPFESARWSSSALIRPEPEECEPVTTQKTHDLCRQLGNTGAILDYEAVVAVRTFLESMGYFYLFMV